MSDDAEIFAGECRQPRHPSAPGSEAVALERCGAILDERVATEEAGGMTAGQDIPLYIGRHRWAQPAGGAPFSTGAKRARSGVVGLQISI